MSDWLYSDKVKDHFMNPKNILLDEKDYDYNARGEVGSIKCGDQMIFFLKIDEKTNTITDCKWKTYGCASAIASTSILSEMVKGMTLEEAFKLGPKDVARELEGLPDNKIHCSVLGDKALRAAINDYYEKTGQNDKVVKEEAKIICQCMNVTDHEIEEAVLEGARTYYELQEMTKLGTVCGQCEGTATDLMKNYINKHFDKEE